MINALEDPDWSWGPLVRFRPAKNARMDEHYWLRFWLPLILASTLFADFLMPLILMLRSGPLPPAATLVSWYFAWFRSFAIGSTLFMLFFLSLALLAVTWAWNRRADRLQREPEPLPELSPVLPQEGVWPPAPRRL